MEKETTYNGNVKIIISNDENGMPKTQMVEKYQMKSWNIKARIKTYNPDFNFEKWDKQ